jgi:transcriptional regulator with XRE-family HTH domain
MDLVLKLRELRRMRNLTQHEVARRTGIGVKTISSFETGDRIHSITVAQLARLLDAYDVTIPQFFSSSFDREVAPWMFEEQSQLTKLIAAVEKLPSYAQEIVIEKVRLALDVAVSVSSSFQQRKEEGRRVAAHRSV